VILLIGAVGFAIGLAAHDLAIQALVDDHPLRPFNGICPACRSDRGWLRPRCPRCGRIVGREALLVVGTTGAAVLFAGTIGLNWALFAYLGFLLLTAALLVTDIEAFRIVDRLNLRGSAAVALGLAVLSLVDGEGGSLVRALLGAAVYFAGSFALWLLVRGRGFGAGDVKLAPQLGMFTVYVSWGTLGWAVFATALLGGILALLMVAVGRAGMKTELPYGPPMILGAWVAIALAGIDSFPLPS